MILRPYEPGMWPCVARLLENWESMPYARSRYGKSAAVALCRERTAQVLANPAAQTLTAQVQDALVGTAVLTLLPWDSEQIGMSAARLDCLLAAGDYVQRRDIFTTLLEHILEQAQGRNIRHLSARVDAGDLALVHALEYAGLELIDGLLTFAVELKDFTLPEPTGSFQLRLATVDDADRAAQLANGAYLHDRFHADIAISAKHADALHASWVRNSCSGKAADGVIVAEAGEELLGFVTCKVNRDTQSHFGAPTGTIVLVATAEAARGQGVGKAATMAALGWMRSQGVELVEVGTQIRNIAAGRLYESCGFRLSGSSLTFRKLL